MAVHTVSTFLNDVFNSDHFDRVVVISIIKTGLPSLKQWDQMWSNLSIQRKEQLIVEIRRFLGAPTNCLEEGNEYLIDSYKARKIFERLNFFYEEDMEL